MGASRQKNSSRRDLRQKTFVGVQGLVSVSLGQPIAKEGKIVDVSAHAIKLVVLRDDLDSEHRSSLYLDYLVGEPVSFLIPNFALELEGVIQVVRKGESSSSLELVVNFDPSVSEEWVASFQELLEDMSEALGYR